MAGRQDPIRRTPTRTPIRTPIRTPYAHLYARSPHACTHVQDVPVPPRATRHAPHATPTPLSRGQSRGQQAAEGCSYVGSEVDSKVWADLVAAGKGRGRVVQAAGRPVCTEVNGCRDREGAELDSAIDREQS